MRVSGLLAMTLFALLLTGCTYTTAKTSVLRPAKWNLAGYDNIVFGAFQDNAESKNYGTADHIRSRLMVRASNSGAFQVLDNESMDEMAEQSYLADLGYTDSSSNGGKMSAAHALVTGRIVSHRFSQNRQQARTDMETGAVYFRNVGNAHVSAMIRVTDIATSDVIGMETLSSNRSAESGESIAPLDLDPLPLYDGAAMDIVDEFMKNMAPYTEVVEVKLYNQGGGSARDLGHKHFKNANYRDAIDAYEMALQQELDRQEIKRKPNRKRRAYCLYNLANAYLCNGDLEKAKELFEEAKIYYPDQSITESLRRVDRRMGERTDLINQGRI